MNAHYTYFFRQQSCRACFLAKPDQAVLREFLARLQTTLLQGQKQAACNLKEVPKGRGDTLTFNQVQASAIAEEQDAFSSPVCYARDPDLREGFEDLQ